MRNWCVRRTAKNPAPAASNPPEASLEAGKRSPPKPTENKPSPPKTQNRPNSLVHANMHPPSTLEPAHTFRRRLTHSNKHKTLRQTQARFLPQSQPNSGLDEAGNTKRLQLPPRLWIVRLRCLFLILSKARCSREKRLRLRPNKLRLDRKPILVRSQLAGTSNPTVYQPGPARLLVQAGKQLSHNGLTWLPPHRA